MNVREILAAELKRLGADGLGNSEISCGCGIDDFSPCECDSILDCVPARRKIAALEDVDEDSEFEVGDAIFVPL